MMSGSLWIRYTNEMYMYKLGATVTKGGIATAERKKAV